MFEVAHNRVVNVGCVDWKHAAEKWPVWRAHNCDADTLVQQSARQLGLVDFTAYIWQEGTTDTPILARDFDPCTLMPDKPVVVALELIEDGMDKEEYTALCESVWNRLNKPQTVNISEVGSEEWGQLKETAGVSLKAFGTPLTGLELQPTQPVQGSSPAQPANSCCFDKQHIEDNIKGSFDNEKYLVFDIGQDPNFLTVTGMHAELGCSVIGTSSFCLLLRTSLACGVPSNGTTWIWDVKAMAAGAAHHSAAPDAAGGKEGHGPGHVITACSAANKLGDEAAQSSTECNSTDRATDDADEADLAAQSMQAMTRLLLANIHAPEQRPIVTLIDSQGTHIFFWLDGRTIKYCDAPDAATAWALTRAVLEAQEKGARFGDGSNGPAAATKCPQCIQQIVQRQKLQVRNGSVECAQLAEIADCLDDEEVEATRAAILLRQLWALPAFSAIRNSAA